MADRPTIPRAQVDQYLRWWSEQERTPKWAERYGGKIEQVQQLLADSEDAIEEERARQERAELDRRNLRRSFLAIVGVLSVLCVILGIFGIRALHKANEQQALAQKNFHDAQIQKALALEANRNALIQHSLAVTARMAANDHALQAAEWYRKAASEHALAQAMNVKLLASNKKLADEVQIADSQTRRAKANFADATHSRGNLFLESGRAELARGDVQDAEVLLAAAYRDDPGNPSVRVLLPEAVERMQTEIKTIRVGPANSSILALAYNPNTNDPSFATGDSSGAIVLFSADGRMLARYTDQHDTISALAFNPSGTQLATGARDGTLVVRDLVSHTNKALKGHDSRINAITFSPDGNQLATISADGTAKIWATGTGALLHNLPLTDTSDDFPPFGYDVQFTHDGKLLTTCSTPGGFRVWDIESGKAQQFATGDQVRLARGCRHIAISPGGAIAAIDWTTEDPGRIILINIDLQKSSITHYNARPVRKSINSLSFDPSGRYVLAASDDGTAAVVDAATGDLIHVFRHQGGSDVTNQVADAGFSSNGASVVTVQKDGTVNMYDLATLDVVSLRPERQGSHIAFAPASDAFVTSGNSSLSARTSTSDVILWHLPRRAGTVTERVHRGPVTQIAVSSDQSIFATAGRDGRIGLWAYSGSPRLLKTLPTTADGAWVSELHFNSKGNAMVAAAGRHLRTWSVSPTGASDALNLETSNQDLVYSDALFDPTGGLVFAQRSTYGDLGLYRQEGWGLWPRLADRPIVNLRGEWLRQATKVFLADDARDVIVFSKANGNVLFIRRLTGERYYPHPYLRISEIALTRSSRIAALGGSWGEISIIEASTGKRKAYWSEHPSVFGTAGHAPITALAFSDDEKWLASAGAYDGKVRLWNVAEMNGRGEFGREATSRFELDRGSPSEVSYVEFSPGDGRIILTVSSDGDAQLWSHDSGELLETLTIPNSHISCAGFIAGGKAVAVGSEEGQVSVMPILPNHAQLKSLIRSVWQSRAGKYLAAQGSVQSALHELGMPR